MHHHYDDIRSRIADEPKWFDESGVPRYCDFSPDETANIYADQIALVLIACQSCGKQFRVCMVSDMMRLVYERPSLWEQIKDGSLHYGDPPNVRCCPAGPTMNCIDIRVLEAWQKQQAEPSRVPEYEIDLNVE
jgi:hypothetical protein